MIVGNTRCNLAGSDLNRQYKHTVKEAFPTVHHVKEMINKLREDDVRVMLYCDLHAHSRLDEMFYNFNLKFLLELQIVTINL